MQPDELLALRDKHGWTQQDVATALNAATGRKYNTDTLRRWEKNERAIPAGVAAFLRELDVGANLGSVAPDEPLSGPQATPGDASDDPAAAADTAPGGGPVASLPAQPALGSGGGHYYTACKELWELIATGVGMAGAATGNMALVNDGQIIAADSEALARAWAKLAETNTTFQKMLAGMTEGGAWLTVALVTGTTVSKCWQSHNYYALQLREQASQNGHAAEPEHAAA